MGRFSREVGAQLRPIRADELEALLGLYQHLHLQDDPLPAREELERLWQQIVANPLLHYLGAELDGRLVATCTLTVIPNLTRGARPYGLLENVVTHPDYRRRGLGRQLLRYALRRAWDLACYKVMLMTGHREDAVLRFYESAGLEQGLKTAFLARRPKRGPNRAVR